MNILLLSQIQRRLKFKFKKIKVEFDVDVLYLCESISISIHFHSHFFIYILPTPSARKMIRWSWKVAAAVAVANQFSMRVFCEHFSASAVVRFWCSIFSNSSSRRVCKIKKKKAWAIVCVWKFLFFLERVTKHHPLPFLSYIFCFMCIT